jgi:hypothetical protein
VLGDGCFVAIAQGDTRNENVIHLDDQKLLLALPGFAHRNRCFLDVLPGRACFQQDW